MCWDVDTYMKGYYASRNGNWYGTPMHPGQNIEYPDEKCLMHIPRRCGKTKLIHRHVEAMMLQGYIVEYIERKMGPEVTPRWSIRRIIQRHMDRQNDDALFIHRPWPYSNHGMFNCKGEFVPIPEALIKRDLMCVWKQSEENIDE